VKKPVDNLTLRAEDGEALIARVHLSNLPRADAERVEWVIRMYFYVVCALQEAKLSVKRLRSLLFGKSPAPSLAPEESSAASWSPFPSASLQTVRDTFASHRLPVIDAETRCGSGRPAWMASCQRRQPTRGLRRLDAMTRIQSGFSARPCVFRSTSFRT
jgi:hypothetical protein